MVNGWKFVVLGGVVALTLSQVGCGTQSLTPSLSGSSPMTLRGTVHGGQQPVSLATIQLWQVGTTGDGSADGQDRRDRRVQHHHGLQLPGE
jgi:protocatechuate 3,4-dioxygenase beta subunit